MILSKHFSPINTCIRQGALGDCWLISAVISLAVVRPDLIFRIFHKYSRKTNEKGYYRLRFYLNGYKKEIDIDDELPCDQTVEDHY